jgi:sulfatase maturation enzyme AslB (radical SAM superfamily)
MENLHIEATKYTPEINLDAEKGLIQIKGKSYPENTFEFYKPVMDWLEEYFKNPKDNTTVEMEIVYFNSSSSKQFFDLFDLLEENKDKTNLKVKWIYDPENENALEAGEDFKEDFEDLDIELVEKEEE